MNKYFVAITKTITEDYDIPVFAQTQEQAKKIAEELIGKELLGQCYRKEVAFGIDFVRGKNMKIIDLDDSN